MDHYAVIGNPISHSKSPDIHQYFAKQTGQSLSYKTILAEKNDFKKMVDDFFMNQQGKGLNVTVPFKEDAWNLVDKKTQRAELAGAVNTIIPQRDGRLLGDNTDGIGLLNDLMKNYHLQIKQKNILLLGAGGAARGIIKPLLDAEPALLIIANRTVSKAHQLARIFESFGRLNACGFDELEHQSFDIIINATASSLNKQIPAIPASTITNETVAYDLMYSKINTPFNQWCLDNGAKQVFDGLGMLVEQAAEAFYLWRNVRPETHDVIEKLLQQSA
ncbi:MAG: shikimate dehydrogenase [Methylococcales bacterium]|nr:shikimate dehydrogenase [Methylococcales bacterium]MBT7409328.1 shikimate dehydrogenase [Methylococcales bacterium]